MSTTPGSAMNFGQTPPTNYSASNTWSQNGSTQGPGFDTIDPNSLQFGGTPGGANAAANSYASQAQGAQGIAAPTVQNRFTDSANNTAVSDLSQQYDALGQLQAEANGQHLPGVDAQRQQGLAAAYANQSSLARGAGAGSAGAAAQRAQGFNNANTAIGTGNAGAIQNAQNQAQAQQQYASAASNFANQTQGYLNNQTGLSAGMGANQLNQQGINNSLTQGYQNLAGATEGQQLSASTGTYNTLNQANTNQQAAKNTAGAVWQNSLESAGINAVAAATSAALLSDINMKQGVQPAGMAPMMSTLGPRGMPAPQVSEGTKAMPLGQPPQVPARPSFAMQPMIVSDERTKEPSLHETEADKFLATMSPYSYRYKDPSNEPTNTPNGGRYLGVMAQNLEKGPTGDTLVKETPRGKALEGNALMSAMAAGEGRLHERLSAAEAKLAAMGGGRG